MIFDEGNRRCALERKRAALGAPCLVFVEGGLIHIPTFRIIAESEDDQLTQLRLCDPEHHQPFLLAPRAAP